MDKIGFKTAVQFTGNQKSRHQSLMEKVDNYFYFGGRKVVVERTADGHEAAVGFTEQPLSTAHKVLKALSYVIFPIPLAMLGMKLILRKIYKFDMGNFDQNAHLQLDNQGTVTKVRTVMDEVLGSQEDVGGAEAKYEEFKRRALTRKTIESNDELAFVLSDKDKEVLRDGFNTEGVQIVQGGGHTVFFLDSQPAVVFKQMSSTEGCKKYLADIELARHVVNEEQLDLLFIPRAKSVKIGSLAFIAQERASLVGSNYHFQKGLYHRCWVDPDMREYMIKLYTQLITFIVKTGFSDVKYDNIPFAMDGRVALIDLDSTSGIKGLTQARAGKRDGILNYTSLDNIEDFYDQARELLGDKANELDRFLEYGRKRLEARNEKDERYVQFCEEHGIHSTRQLLNEELPLLFDDKKVQRFAEDLVKCINEKLSKQENLTLRTGRRVIIGEYDRIYYSAANYGIITEHKSFNDYLKEVCTVLQAAGYIFRFKIDSYGNFIRITC